MSDTTYIIISSVHWHSTWQSVHNITQELATRGYEVIFVEPLPKRWPKPSEVGRVFNRLRKSNLGGGRVFQQKPTGVTFISPVLLPDAGMLPQWINLQFFTRSVANQILTRCHNNTRVVLNYLPTSVSISLLSALKPSASIYICFYDYTHDPHAGAIKTEPLMYDIVDAVIADSPENIRRSELHHDLVLHSEGGVNLDNFLRHTYPPITKTNDPLCIYFGTIGKSIDQDLLEAISQKFRLKLIGPIEVKDLKLSPKTEIIGAVPFQELPAHLIEGDVLVLPYAKKAHTTAVTPAKLFECMITGKPIVSINLPSLSKYSEVIYNCNSHEEFLDTITNSTDESPNLRLKRIRIAKENTWEKLVDRIEDLVTSIQSNKGDKNLKQR